VRRRLFTLAAAVSLVLCLATIALWFRGIGHWDEIFYLHTPYASGSGTGNECYVHTWDGSFALELDLLRDPPSKPLVKRSFLWRTTDLSRTDMRDYLAYRVGETSAAGFGWSTRQQSNPFGRRQRFIARVPKWFVIVMTGTLPTLWLLARRRQKWRAQRHLCAVCGYDLRASPDRCPECGTEAKPQSTEGATA
jgi:hypothetical protein